MPSNNTHNACLYANLLHTDDHKIDDGANKYQLYINFLLVIEPKKIDVALEDPYLVNAMKEELSYLKDNKLWQPVLMPFGKVIIGMKWIYRQDGREWCGDKKQSWYGSSEIHTRRGYRLCLDFFFCGLN